MIVNKGKFSLGVILMAAFTCVLILIFMPIYNGQNGLNYLDSLYNSISKGSAYYIPALKQEIAPYSGNQVALKLELNSEDQAKQSAALFWNSGGAATPAGNILEISADLGKTLSACLEDSDIMYRNEGQTVKNKYQNDERVVMFNWWTVLNAMDKELKAQSKFKEAKICGTVLKKGVETSYNYYQIEPQKISDKIGIVIFSLIFYVIYTLWYGFGIMFLFEGWGLRLEH
jgi:hypothetical protein